MIPGIIVVDTEAPEKGASVFGSHVLVRKENLNQLLEGIKTFFQEEPIIFNSKKEFLDAIEKKKKEGTHSS